MTNILLGISLTLNIIFMLVILIYLKFKLMTKKELKNLKEVLTNDNNAIEDVNAFIDFFGGK